MGFMPTQKHIIMLQLPQHVVAVPALFVLHLPTTALPKDKTHLEHISALLLRCCSSGGIILNSSAKLALAQGLCAPSLTVMATPSKSLLAMGIIDSTGALTGGLPPESLNTPVPLHAAAAGLLLSTLSHHHPSNACYTVPMLYSYYRPTCPVGAPRSASTQWAMSSLLLQTSSPSFFGLWCITPLPLIDLSVNPSTARGCVLSFLSIPVFCSAFIWLVLSSCRLLHCQQRVQPARSAGHRDSNAISVRQCCHPVFSLHDPGLHHTLRTPAVRAHPLHCPAILWLATIHCSHSAGSMVAVHCCLAVIRSLHKAASVGSQSTKPFLTQCATDPCLATGRWPAPQIQPSRCSLPSAPSCSCQAPRGWARVCWVRLWAQTPPPAASPPGQPASTTTA